MRKWRRTVQLELCVGNYRLTLIDFRLKNKNKYIGMSVGHVRSNYLVAIGLRQTCHTCYDPRDLNAGTFKNIKKL